MSPWTPMCCRATPNGCVVARPNGWIEANQADSSSVCVSLGMNFGTWS